LPDQFIVSKVRL